MYIGVTLLRASGVTVDILTGLERRCLEPNRHVLGTEWNTWLHSTTSYGDRNISHQLNHDINKLYVENDKISYRIDQARPNVGVDDHQSHCGHIHHTHAISSSTTTHDLPYVTSTTTSSYTQTSPSPSIGTATTPLMISPTTTTTTKH